MMSFFQSRLTQVGLIVVLQLSLAQTAITAAIGFMNRSVLLKVFSGVSLVTDRWFGKAQTGRATPIRSADVIVPLDPREHRG